MQQVYLIAATLFTCHVVYLFVRRRIRARNLPPKFWTLDPIMNFDWMVSGATDARNQLKHFAKYGSTYRLPRLLDPMATVVSCHPENVYNITSGKDWGVEYRKAGMGPILGSGFICTDGAEWMRSRKMVRPAFNRPNIDNFNVLEGVADEIIKKIETADGKAEMGALLYDALMHSSMHFILGLDSREKNDGRPMDVKTFNTLWQQGVMGMGIRLMLGENISKLLPNAQYNDLCSKLHSFVDFAIGKGAAASSDSTATDKKTKSMAEIIAPNARDIADCRAQLMQTLLGSQDTTSVLTCNVIQLLSTRPHLWAQLREEATTAGPELFTWDSLCDNSLVRNILFETLRIRPVFPQIGRLAVVDTVLPTGGGPNHDQPLPIPKGTFGLANSYGVHLSKDIYGPDAEEFKPDRWNSVKPTNKEYLPFGAGPRACLGKDKALAEAAYLLMRLVKRFEGLEDRTGVYKPDASFSMKNRAGYHVTFR